jgi:alpha,alpha-trehalase
MDSPLTIRRSLYAAVLIILGVFSAVAQRESYSVPVAPTLDSLLADEDTDHDNKITIEDHHIAGTNRGDQQFWFFTTDNRRVEVVGTYYLSNLLQELSLARAAHHDTAALSTGRIFERPSERLSRQIREQFWDGLTRRLDEQGLPKVFADPKAATLDGKHYVFVPPSDYLAYQYYTDIANRHPDWKMEVVRLPDPVTPEYVRQLDGYHGILTLAVKKVNGRTTALPFVVPGGRFNEMYGWDSYFIVLGLLHDGRVDLARSMVDNALYEIRHYGAILNANRTYYLTRSQPPFFTSMLLAVYRRLSKNAATREWLRAGLQGAIQEYTHIWMGPDRITKTGLSRYYDTGYGPPPEAGSFDDVFKPYAEQAGMSLEEFKQAYRTGKIKNPELDKYFKDDRAMRESGHDTSYRLIGRCTDLVTVDLNSLLYKIERDIAHTIAEEFGGSLTMPDGQKETPQDWNRRAENRKKLVNTYLWDGERGMYSDYDFVQNARTHYVSATILYPLWAGLASPQQAKSLIQKALPELETPGGIVGSTEESRGPITDTRPLRQWDYPFGWSPHQMLVWQGLINYGYADAARRLVYRWLFTITSNAANYNGTIPEKYDVVRRTHRVFVEYGNVGTEFSYITQEGFGWTNASYQIGLSLLPKRLRAPLDRLIPPEWIAAFHR